MKQGWEHKKLKDVCEKITDGTHQTPKYFESGYIFLSSKNVTSGKIDWDNIKYIDEVQHLEMQKRVSPKMGDILLAKNGTTGVAAIVDKDVEFDIYVSLAWLRSKGEVLPEFLLHFINSPNAKSQFNRRLKGIGVPNLHLEEIREVDISYPKSLPEQQRIVYILDEAFSAIAKAKANAEQNLKNAKELFESYLQGVFENKGDGWEIKRLGEVCDLQNGFAFKSTDYIEFSNTVNFRMSQIRPGGGVDLENNPKYLPDEYAITYKDYLLKEGDIVIAMTDMATETKILGVPTIVLSDSRNWLLNQRVGKLFNIDKSKVNIAFLKYILVSEPINEYYKKLGRGGLQINIGKQDILNAKIPLPPLPKQQTIVRQLDALRAETQKLEAVYQKKIADLEELKKSILQKAFAGELKTEKAVAV
ncbi:MAG: restriction endonuclease subunit S [Flammeovirgaceae bacterium]